MIDWFVQTLRSYPEIAIFLSLALGLLLRVLHLSRSWSRRGNRDPDRGR